MVTIADVSDRKNENSGYSFICAFNKSNIFGIEYLHQLQNLYFVFTNKELEINL